MRIKYRGTTYPIATVDDVPLVAALAWEDDVRAAGGTAGVSSWLDLVGAVYAINALPPQERRHHPAFLLVQATILWAARRVAGESVAFGDMLGELTISDVLDMYEGTAPAAPVVDGGKGPASRRASSKTSRGTSPAASSGDSSPSAV